MPPKKDPKLERALSSSSERIRMPLRSAAVQQPLVSSRSTPSARFAPRIQVSKLSQSGNDSKSESKESVVEDDQMIDLASVLAHNLTTRTKSLQFKNTTTYPQKSAITQQAIQRSMTMQAKLELERKKRKQQGGEDVNKNKSKHLVDLSFPESKKTDDGRTSETFESAPLSLPFLYRDVEDNTAISSKRPSIRVVDESNRDVASLLDPDVLDDHDLPGRHWLLLQLPLWLPELDKAKIEEERRKLEVPVEGDDAVERSSKHKTPNSSRSSSIADTGNYSCSALAGLPEGHLGTMQIHESGKIKFKIGNHVFDVNQGAQNSFVQEIACHKKSQDEMLFLGPCNRKLVVSPNLHGVLGTTDLGDI